MINKEYVIYTALFGGYDDLQEIPEISPTCDYLCFTDDSSLKSNTWKIIIVENRTNMTPHMMNRNYKILPHRYLKGYRISLYIDSNIILKRDPSYLFERYGDEKGIRCFRHFSRNCIYAEGFANIKSKKAKYENVVSQLSKYIEQGYPKNNGLSENRVILRHHNNKPVVRIMEQWWQELQQETNRDQLSLWYIAWINDTRIEYLDEHHNRVTDIFGLNLHRDENITSVTRFIRKISRFNQIWKYYPKYYYHILRKL
jgi:hypothetical protein